MWEARGEDRSTPSRRSTGPRGRAQDGARHDPPPDGDGAHTRGDRGGAPRARCRARGTPVSETTCHHVADLESALEACRRHLESIGCEECRRALVAATSDRQRELGARGGAAGQGDAKRRGGKTKAEISAYMKALRARVKRP